MHTGGEVCRSRLPSRVLESKRRRAAGTPLNNGAADYCLGEVEEEERMVEEDMQLVQDAATIGDGPRSLWESAATRDGEESTDSGPPLHRPP